MFSTKTKMDKKQRCQQNPKLLLHLVIILTIFINLSLSSSFTSSSSSLNENHLIKRSPHDSSKPSFIETNVKPSFKKSHRKLKKSSRAKKSNRKARLYFSGVTTTQVTPIHIDDEALDQLLSRKSEVTVPIPYPSSEYAGMTSVKPQQSYAERSINDVSLDNVKALECSNDTIKEDLGLACFKKGLIMAPTLSEDLNKTSNTKPPSRYFSVKPMLFDKRKKNPNFKTPAQTARQMSLSKGYPLKPKKYPPKVKQYSEPSQLPPPQSIQSRNPFLINNAGFRPKLDAKIQEDIELLNSLKSSLGVLDAQASNVKQRTILLYRETKRRKLSFFDGLLMRTHDVINEKQEEARRAIDDIDNALDRIKRHQKYQLELQQPPQYLVRSPQSSSFHIFTVGSSRRNSRYAEPDRFPNGMRKPTPKPPEFNQKQIDRLMLNGLNHAKHMMATVRQLNEALDEFEDTFNFPRFEPNTIIDDYLKDTELR